MLAETQERLKARPLGWDSSFVLTCKRMGKAEARRGHLLPSGTKIPHRAAASGGCTGKRARDAQILRWDNCGQRRERSLHLPGEPQAADSSIVQPHDHSVEGQQVLVLLAAVREGGGVRGNPATMASPATTISAYMAAILMNFLSSCTRLPGASQSSTSVATQWVTSLQRCNSNSRLAVSRRPRSPWNT